MRTIEAVALATKLADQHDWPHGAYNTHTGSVAARYPAEGTLAQLQYPTRWTTEQKVEWAQRHQPDRTLWQGLRFRLQTSTGRWVSSPAGTLTDNPAFSAIYDYVDYPTPEQRKHLLDGLRLHHCCDILLVDF